MILSSRYRASGSVLHTSQNSVIQYYAGLKPSPIILWICISLLLLYPLSLFLWVRGMVDLSENVPNRILMVLIGGFGLLNAMAIIRYYFRNLALADWFFVLFSCFYFYGLNDLDLQAYSRYARLIIWFYIVPFYLRQASGFKSNLNTVLVPILILIMIVSYMHLGYFHTSERLGLAGGATSTARFYLCIFSICLITLSNAQMLFVQRFLVILVMTGAVIFALLSGSRQAFVGFSHGTALPT